MASDKQAIETVQVKVRLTEDQDILNELKQHGRLKKNTEGKYQMSIAFDSKEFVLHPGTVLIVGKKVANALRRDSTIIMGDHLTGDVRYGIEQIGEFDMLSGGGVQEGARLSATTCPVCQEEYETAPQMVKCLMGHKSEHPELFETKEESRNRDEREIRRNPQTGKLETVQLPNLDAASV